MVPDGAACFRSRCENQPAEAEAGLLRCFQVGIGFC